MVEEKEIIMLVMGIGVYGFTVAYRLQLKRIPRWDVIFLAYRLMLAAWLMTVLEGFFWAGVLNTLEHLCYAGSAAAMTWWCYRVVWAENRRTP